MVFFLSKSCGTVACIRERDLERKPVLITFGLRWSSSVFFLRFFSPRWDVYFSFLFIFCLILWNLHSGLSFGGNADTTIRLTKLCLAISSLLTRMWMPGKIRVQLGSTNFGALVVRGRGFRNIFGCFFLESMLASSLWRGSGGSGKSLYGCDKNTQKCRAAWSMSASLNVLLINFTMHLSKS